MEKKFTKRNAITTLLTLSEVQADPRLVAYCENELKLLDKKNNTEKKPTAKQVENGSIREDIRIWFMNHPEEKLTCAQVGERVETCIGLSTSKIAALVKPLIDDNILKKELEKRIIYYSLA